MSAIFYLFFTFLKFEYKRRILSQNSKLTNSNKYFLNINLLEPTFFLLNNLRLYFDQALRKFCKFRKKCQILDQ